MRIRLPIRIGRFLVGGGAIAVVAFVAAFGSVAAAPEPSVAPVPCVPGSLVTALAAVSGSGQSGTVTLTAGCTYTMTVVNNTVDGENAFPDVLGSVTIVGNSATITRSGSTQFRFFMVDDGGSLNLSNLTLSNGSIPLGDLHGGGAILNRSTLTVSGVNFLNNQSQGTTGGGAIDNHDAGQLTVTKSTFTGNVGLQGGGIEDEATLCHTSTPNCGNATVTRSTFTNNSTTQYGGGGFESQLDGPNPALICGPWPWGTAACQEPGGAHDTLVGDTFSGNTSITEGGGIANFGTTTLTNSTLYNNSTGSGGGGGVQNTGTLSIVQSTIAANTSAYGANVHSFADATHTPGTITLTMSIVSGGVSGANCGGTVAMTDGGYNLDDGTSCGFSGTGSLSSTNPDLTPLASNGGPTQTMGLLVGGKGIGPSSPAIDAIPTSFAGCSGSFDQRGVSRPQYAGCDIGAYEVYLTPPSVPTGVKAVVGSAPDEVDLSWNASTDLLAVTGYDIWRNGSASPIATVSGSTLAYADKAVVDVTTYNYTVDAFDAAGNVSAQSSIASVTTPDWTPPSVPTGVSATALTNTPQVNVKWNASTDNVGVTGYDIYRNGSSTLLATVSGSTLTYADKAVVDLTHYSYTVDAFDAAGNHSAQSAAGSVTTPDWTPPTVPTGLTASTTKTPQVNLSWSASTDNVAVTGYTIYRNGGQIATVGGSTLTYTDLKVSGMTTYTYTVDAYDAAGNHSAQTAPISANPGDVTPPSVPTGLTAVGSSTANVTLSWVASTDNVGVTGYTVYRNGAPLNTVSGSTLSYVDTTVAGSTAYTYQVDAFDAAGNQSAKSSPAAITTPSFACSTGYSGKLLAGDFTGDHKVDQALITSVGQCVLVSSGSSYAAPTTWSTNPFYGTTATLAGDVTGDGKADLVAVNSTQTFVSTSNGTSFQAPTVWSNIPFYGTRGTYLADVNGDGKADLVAINNTSVWVMLSNGSSFDPPVQWSSIPFYGTRGTYLADLNGDGRTDLLAVNNTSVWVMMSTGTGFGSPTQWSNTAFYGNVTTTVGDVSGDGKADLIAVNNSSLWVMTSTGTGFTAPAMWSNVPFYGSLTTMVADATGDGKADMIAVNQSGSVDDFWVAVSTGGALSAPAFWL